MGAKFTHADTVDALQWMVDTFRHYCTRQDNEENTALNWALDEVLEGLKHQRSKRKEAK